MLKLITELTFISNKKEKNVCFVSKICHLSQSSLNPLPELLYEFIVSGGGGGYALMRTSEGNFGVYGPSSTARSSHPRFLAMDKECGIISCRMLWPASPLILSSLDTLCSPGWPQPLHPAASVSLLWCTSMLSAPSSLSASSQE